MQVALNVSHFSNLVMFHWDFEGCDQWFVCLTISPESNLTTMTFDESFFRGYTKRGFGGGAPSEKSE